MKFLKTNDSNNINELEDLNKLAKIKVYANTLGTVEDITETLISFQRVYNTFILFYIAKNDPEFARGTDYTGLCKSIGSSFHRFGNYLMPMESLVVSKVSFNSPGFWEMIGTLNPLIQIREYLNDRHKRKKDKLLWENESAKSILESRKQELENNKLEIQNNELELANQKLALENTKYSIEVSLKKLELAKEIFNFIEQAGGTETQKREFLNNCIDIFSDFEKLIDSERITSIEILNNVCEEKNNKSRLAHSTQKHRKLAKLIAIFE